MIDENIKRAPIKSHSGVLPQTPKKRPPKDWKIVPLEYVFKKVNLRDREIFIKDAESYRLITVKLYSQGIVLREEKEGKKIGTKRLYYVKENDFVFSKIDVRNGAWGFVPSELEGALVSTDFPILRTKENVAVPKFLHFYLIRPEIWEMVKNLAMGTTNRQRTHSEVLLKSIFIFLPPLPEQRKIAEILETVDRAIEKTDAIIEKYKRIKQGLMQDLLTRGIDESGKIRSEETHRFKDSPLGRIPEEWEVVMFYDLFDVIDNRGRTPPFSEEGKIPYLTAENIRAGRIKYNFENYVTDEIYNKYMRGIPDENYILFTTEAPLGEVALSPRIKFCFAQRVIAIKPKLGIPLYYVYQIQYNFIKNQLNNLVSGTTVKGISAKNLRRVHFIIPPLPEQKRIAEVLSQIDSVIEKEEKYKEKLERLKRGLMEDLLTGRVRVTQLLNEEVG